MKNIYFFILFICFLFSCEPLSETFDEKTIDCQYYEKQDIISIPQVDSTIMVMTWNIRFGAARIPWFGDACGQRVILDKNEVEFNLQGICDLINSVKPQILLLQEVDLSSKRTAYINQVQYILDHTFLNYAVYASGWKSQFIPSNGLGRMDCGNAILSVWKIEGANRHSLPLRNDADALTKYFYLRDNFISARIAVPGINNLYAVNVHLVSTTGDDTKKRQADEFLNVVKDMSNSGKIIISGGDFNLIPPNADTIDFCLIDMCPGEDFHSPGDNPFHKDGSNYEAGITWIQPIYDYLNPSLSLTDYKLNQYENFTHTLNPEHFWCRMIDYLFTNTDWIDNSHKVHQETMELSDHAPVSALWRVK
ncbi:MAG: endonuclease/exonuclease/phosphatase family protein [bacterium]